MDFKESKLIEFLTQIWGSDNETVFLAYKSSPVAFTIPNSQVWPDSKEQIAKWAISSSNRGREVYFSPALYKEGSTNKEKANVRGSRVVWVDIDGQADDILAQLTSLRLPVPTWRIGTGRDGHEHWHWLLSREIDIQRLEDINKRLAYCFNADNCWNADRVLRLPFTRNHMLGKEDIVKEKGLKPPFPVDFIAVHESAYEPEDFDSLPAVKESVKEAIVLGDIPKTTEVLAKYKWDDQHYDLFTNPGELSSRSDAIVRLAYFGAEAGMPDEAIYAIISNFDNRVGKFKGRADRERRLADIIIKARDKYPFKQLPSVSVQEDTKLVYGLKELLESDFRIDWLIDHFIPQRTINFISAESGIGKSRLSMQLALAGARGGKFLKWKINKPLKTLYLSLEMAGDMLKHFAEGLTQDTEVTDLDNENFLLVPVGNAIDMTSDEGLEFIENLIKEVKPDLMFIDALGSLTFEDLDGTHAKTINNRLKNLINEYGTTFFIIHHNRKPDQSGSKRPTLASVYGSQYVLTEAAVVLTMHMEENQSNVELIPIKTRADMAPDPIMLDGKQGFNFVLKQTGESSGGSKTEYDIQ